MIALMKVDFPEPFGPMMAVKLPLGIFRVILSKTLWFPKETVIPDTEMAGNADLVIFCDDLGIVKE